MLWEERSTKGVVMPKKRKVTKKATKKTARATKAAKKPRKSTPKAKAPERSVVETVQSKAIDLLRSWSPSRYSHR